MGHHFTSEHGAAYRAAYEAVHGVYPVVEPLECQECEQVRQAVLRWEQQTARQDQSAEGQGVLHGFPFVVDLRPLESLDG